MKINGLFIAAVFFLTLCVLILRPVPIPKEKNCLVVSGEVTSIFEAGVKDVVFKLKDNPTNYYINRGLEQGLTLDNLRAQLMNEEIIIKYPRYWTPLDPKNRTRHITKVEFGVEVIFSEI